MRASALVLLLLAAGCGRGGPSPSAAPAAEGVTFLVSVPAGTPEDAVVHLAGDFQGWNPGDARYALARRDDGRHAITLPLAAGRPVEFKFTLGSWQRVEKGPQGEELDNRRLVPASPREVHEFRVASWADGSPPARQVTGEVEIFSIEGFLGGRTIRVWLPPGYRDGEARYPVLYMMDGQNLYDASTSFAGEWQVDETADRLIRAGEVAPFLVVGIDNAGGERMREYTPWGEARGGGGGDAFLVALRDRLMPEIARRYRVRSGADHTWIGGSSLGGLIAAYAGWAHGDTFGRVMAMSPSYQWAGGRIFGFARDAARPAMTRFYQDMGTLEGGGTTDRDGDGRDDFVAALEAMAEIARARGLVEGRDLLTVVGEGQRHHERYWAERLPDALRFVADRP